MAPCMERRVWCFMCKRGYAASIHQPPLVAVRVAQQFVRHDSGWAFGHGPQALKQGPGMPVLTGSPWWFAQQRLPVSSCPHQPPPVPKAARSRDKRPQQAVAAAACSVACTCTISCGRRHCLHKWGASRLQPVPDCQCSCDTLLQHRVVQSAAAAPPGNAALPLPPAAAGAV